MAFLAFLLVLGIVLLIIAGLVGLAAFIHRDVSGDHKDGGDTVSINELLK